MPKIQVRRGTSQEIGNIIPDVGEPYFVTDTKKAGFGDGINTISSDNIGVVSKTGDTMTGALTIEAVGSGTDATQNNCRVYLKNSLMDVNATPSENLISSFTFTDKYGNQTGACYNRQRTNGVSDTRLSVNKNDKSAILAVGLNANDIAYCTFPNSICVDGQWVYSNVTICTGCVAETSDKTWDLSAYLPDDNYGYELLLIGTSNTGTTSGDINRILVKSSIITSNCALAACQTRTNSANSIFGMSTFPIGADKILTVGGYANNTGTYNLYMRGYRRIGTNS